LPPAESGAPPATGSTAPDRPLGPEASLRAGEIDDNAAFDDYLAYLNEYRVNFRNDGVRPHDISERYLIRVIDDQQRPLVDARVTVFDGDRAIFRGRTYAGGRTIFIADPAEIANAEQLRVVAEYGNAGAETTFVRNSTTSIELGLRGVQIDETLRLDLLFLLDTTGSMDDELRKIQDTIDEIAGRIDGFAPRPEIRYGLVAYKDQDDDYVTQAAPFTSDLAAFRAVLRRLSANGGGDTPEAVDEALYDAVVRAEWSEQPAVRLVFLVADAGPHIRENSQFTYLDGIQTAVERGVKIYPIAASNTDPAAEYVFRQMAQQTLGGFIFLTYQPGASSGAPGESTTLEAGEQPYSVERLDDLIVLIVERELAAAIGAR
ncbi:MAG: VWA domain-containing protein, partial [Oscillochloris sp.]|nr:VWA domain-containing protein [Oscillochloris sp.]